MDRITKEMTCPHCKVKHSDWWELTTDEKEMCSYDYQCKYGCEIEEEEILEENE